MITQGQMAIYVDRACKLKLIGWRMLLKHTIPELGILTNGIGPENFSPRLRNLIDNLNPSILCASVLHDMRYTYGNGTKTDFLQANADLEINADVCAEFAYGWYNPARYWVKLQAKKFKVICDDFGWDAYLAAIEDRKSRPEFEARYSEMRRLICA